MKRRPRVTYETVRQIALTFPCVEDGTSYGTSALKVKGKLFVRLKEDRDSIVVRMRFDLRDEMMSAAPETYYITEHYRNYDYMLVRLSKLLPEALPDLLKIANSAALPSKPKPAKPRRV
jgi:hypothetical protein